MSTEKRTRGRRSKVDLLPSEIKEQLNAMLRDGRLEQTEVLEIVNQKIDNAGLKEAKLSRSGLNRYAARMEQIGSRIREMREVSEVWVSKLGNEPTSDVGKLLQEAVRTLASETSFSLMESGEPVEPKALNQLAMVAQRIEAAAMTSHKREKEIRQAFAQEASAAIDDAAKAQGLTADSVALIKQQILGLA
jgi:hypothetical protein